MLTAAIVANFMFQLSKKTIEEFKEIYSQERGVDLSDEDANRLGIELLEFMQLTYKPIPMRYNSVMDLLRCEALFSFSVNKGQLDFNIEFL